MQKRAVFNIVDADGRRLVGSDTDQGVVNVFLIGTGTNLIGLELTKVLADKTGDSVVMLLKVNRFINQEWAHHVLFQPENCKSLGFVSCLQC